MSSVPFAPSLLRPLLRPFCAPFAPFNAHGMLYSVFVSRRAPPHTPLNLTGQNRLRYSQETESIDLSRLFATFVFRV